MQSLDKRLKDHKHALLYFFLIFFLCCFLVFLDSFIPSYLSFSMNSLCLFIPEKKHVSSGKTILKVSITFCGGQIWTLMSWRYPMCANSTMHRVIPTCIVRFQTHFCLRLCLSVYVCIIILANLLVLSLPVCKNCSRAKPSNSNTLIRNCKCARPGKII